ncbi:MAG: hypothetical protein KC731_15405, partial [Myxococcales bacterium]|nr:hypothetical protein [Myxococcales bacterium]
MRFASLALTVAMGLSLAPAPALAALVPLELQKLTPDGARPSFGMHVALDGDEAIVSATGAEVDGVPNAGEAYYFRRQDGAWLAPQTLMAPTPNPGGGFGRALLGGGLAFVAEPRNSHGQVFVYDIQGGVVAATPTQILTASSPVVGAEFGEALALWGDWLAVGSPGGGSAEGVQLFHYEGGAWVAQQLLLPASDDIRFGVELAMDAGVLMVAAMGSSGDRVHVFREVAGLWQLDQTLSAVPAASDDGFGVLALDAQTALIGAPWAEAATGKVYRFQDNTSSWLFADEMAPEVAIAGDHTGISVALDGQVAVVTASLADGGAAESGVAYLYERASGAWSTPTVVVPSDVTFSQQFGIASALD